MTDGEQRNDSDERNGDEGREDASQGIGGRVLSASPLIWVLLAAAVAWAVWATLSGGGRKDPMARAVVLDTATTARTIVALPCDALRGGSSGANPAQTPGAITTILPKGSGSRIVAVTNCSRSGSTASSLTGGDSGTVVVVPPAGTDVPDKRQQATKLIPGMRLSSVVRLQGQAQASTVVIPPCPTSSAGGSEFKRTTVSARPSGDGVVLVPCPGGS